MFMLCYITCYLMFYNLLCYVIKHVMLLNNLLCYIRCHVILCSITRHFYVI